MRRIILHVSVATIAFMTGVAANWTINTFGGLAVERVNPEPAVDLKIFTILPDEASIPIPAYYHGKIVVSVTADGTLDLSTLPMGTPVGTLNDPRVLSATLRKTFEQREASLAYLATVDLPLRVPEDRILDKTVYIKAPRCIGYGEVADLIALVKAAGADPVGLIAEPRHKP